jgi:hypothetical protein
LYNKIRAPKRKLDNANQVIKQQEKKMRRINLTKKPSNKMQPARSHDNTGPSCGSTDVDIDENELQVAPGSHVEIDICDIDDKQEEQMQVNCTPHKETNTLLRDSHISPTRHPAVAKELVALNTLAQHVANAPKNIKRKILQNAQGVKKQRMIAYLSKKLKVHRKMFIKRRKYAYRRMENQRIKSVILAFLKKRENSTPLPSKRDQLAKGVQKYSLNDTLKNLYQRFREENPTEKVSFSTFAKQKPNYMKTIMYANRRQCLCVKHRNGDLKLKPLKQSVSVAIFLKNNTEQDIDNIIESYPNEIIKFQEWQNEEMEVNGKSVKKLRLRQVEMNKEEFKVMCRDDFNELREHIRRMNAQFSQTTILRNNMPAMTEVTVQIDYAENYKCSYQDEPSAAFFDRRQVTIHPMVVHFKDIDENIQTHSYIGISDQTTHAAPMTFAFLKKLVPELKHKLPDLQVIHYVSDSPASQYRNKNIVKIISEHPQLFNGIQCSWDYLESGHGKGPCDGIGGSIKKGADTAVKSGELIGDAHDFFRWAENYSPRMTCLFVNNGEVQLASRHFSNCPVVKGLSKVHTIRSHEGMLWMRDTSCYEPCCIGQLTCPGWLCTQIPVLGIEEENTERQQEDETPTVHIYSPDDMVEATYNGKTYVGKVIEYDAQNDDYYVTFMKKNRQGVYSWPKRRDEVWVKSGNILKVFAD